MWANRGKRFQGVRQKKRQHFRAAEFREETSKKQNDIVAIACP
jgi:hypothetical protein